jgi:RNA polymerase sigma factor (sigma-70 family)
MESLIQYDDKELFELISQGQKPALIRLFKKYSPGLSDFALGLTKLEVVADEIVQEVFMRIWFNREKLTMFDEPKSYIFHTAAAVGHNFLRQLLLENKVVSVVRNESFYETTEEPSTARLYTLAADIQDAIGSLPADQRKVYELNREQQLKITDIAEELSISPNAVRGLLNTAIESIHEYISNKGHTL